MLNPARRNARERALELLYEAEIKRLSVAEVVAALPLAPDPYAVELVNGVAARQQAIDSEISKHLRSGWSLHRLPTIDRIVLRLGIEELRNRPDVPAAVILDESVRLAKGFSGEESSKFVNGLLAAIARQVRGGEGDPDVLPETADAPGRPGAVRSVPTPPEGAVPADPGMRLEDEPPTGLDG
jgi:transcription antitermination protein NusB